MKLKNKKDLNNKYGFTLVELVVIVLIVSIIFGIGTYFIGGIINNTEERTVALRNNNIKTSARLYLEENANNSEIIWELNTIDNTSIANISVMELINKGYLKKDEVINSENICISVVKNNETGTFVKEDIFELNGDDDDKCKKVKVVTIPTASDICKNPEYVADNNNGIDEKVVLAKIDSRSNYRIKEGAILNEGTDAGSYLVRLELNDVNNYVWSDGTVENKSITCKIKKATPSFDVGVLNESTGKIENRGIGYAVGKSEIISSSSSVSGKISYKNSSKKHVSVNINNSDIGINITNDVAMINVLASRNTDTIVTFTLTPNDSKNYEKVTSIFIVGSSRKKKVLIPVCTNNYEYSGNKIQLINNNDGYRLEGNVVNTIGKYKVTAKLNYGYVWNDGTTEDKEISDGCVVVNKSFNVTFDNMGATTSGMPTSMTVKYDEMVGDLSKIPEKKYIVTYNYSDPITVTNLTPNSYTFQNTYLYSFDGYYSGKNGTGTKYIDGNGKGINVWDIASDATLYANWKVTKLEVPDIPVPDGFDPIYWTKTNSKDTDKINVDTYYPTSDVTLYGWIVDTIAPKCDITPSGTQKLKSISDWYSSDVSLSYACSDVGSGCQSNSEDVFNGIVLKTDGQHSYKDIYVTDYAGNSTKCTDTTIKVDKTKPVITLSDVTAPSGYKSNTIGKFTDSGSGVLKISYSSCLVSSDNLNQQRCGYTYGGNTYAAKPRLEAYLRGSKYYCDLKSAEKICDVTGELTTYDSISYDFSLSWKNSQLVLYAMDAAGNHVAWLEERTNISTISRTDVSSYFSYYTTCQPFPGSSC